MRSSLLRSSPASSTSTETFGSSDKRLAKTQPEVPPPTMIKSYSGVGEVDDIVNGHLGPNGSAQLGSWQRSYTFSHTSNSECRSDWEDLLSEVQDDSCNYGVHPSRLGPGRRKAADS